MPIDKTGMPDVDRKVTMEKIIALCKNRGYIFPGSEIYGGLANTWDYGPLGVEFKNNVKDAWRRKFVQESKYNVGLDAAILMNPETWVASGHVGGFSDPLIDCKACKTRYRADNLIEDYFKEQGIEEIVDGWSNEKMEGFIDISNVMLLVKDKPTRVGFKVVDGKKVRVAKADGSVID